MPISERAEELFIKASELDAETRAEFITSACGGDRELLDEVQSLLAAANEADAYFERLSGKIGLAALANDEAPLPKDTTFGQWRIVKLIGSGGMGSVYLAERADGQFDQRAALKVLPVGLGGPQGKARFLTERQILARLVHDNIARLLDGGVTDDGVPYFVMDFVDGVPIDRYCEERSLSEDDRLRLILDVADAVQYAHRNLVVHRDLKPGNVLVEDGRQVRLLDFGIAKVMEPDGSEADLTRVSQRPATPGYASPEMLRGEPVDVTTDVYSIGVLMYVLLTDRMPLSFEGLSLAEMHARVTGETPPPVSFFNSDVGGDIDAIVSKAMAKQPAERYASVDSLANDIRRYLDGQPVNAKVPSAAYRARKFIARHRVGVAFAAFAVMALAGITGIAVYSAIQAERQAEAIALERDRAEEIRDFLVSIFDSADPNLAAPDMTARDLLDAGRLRIEAELADQPELQAELAFTIGEVYATMRMTNEWRQMLEMELELRRELSGPDSAEYADVLIGMSQLEDMSGNYEASEAYAGESLAIARSLGDRLAEAQAHKRMGRILHLQGDYAGADPHYRAALAIFEAELGVRDVETNKVRLHLATLLNHRRELEESLALLRQVYEIRQEHYPGDHGEYSEVLLAMGSVLSSLGRYGEATETYEGAFAMNDRLFGPDNRFNLFIVNGLGKVAEAEGNYEMAAERYAEARRLTAMYFPDHPNLGIATSNLGKAHMLSGRYDLALPMYREAVDIVSRKLPDHWMLGGMRSRLGLCIVETGGDLEEAETLILFGIDRLMAQWGRDHATTRSAFAAAVSLYDAWGRPIEADKYRETP